MKVIIYTELHKKEGILTSRSQRRRKKDLFISILLIIRNTIELPSADVDLLKSQPISAIELQYNRTAIETELQEEERINQNRTNHRQQLINPITDQRQFIVPLTHKAKGID